MFEIKPEIVAFQNKETGVQSAFRIRVNIPLHYGGSENAGNR